MNEPVTPHPGHRDHVAGDPPVPISVWRTAHTPDDATTLMPARLAARLVTAYSRPGEQVIDLTPGHTLAAAATYGARTHLPAWFTDSTLTIGPASPTPTDDTTGPDRPHWYGDDLTDTDLPGPAEPAPDGPDGDLPDKGSRASLVVAPWPLEDGDAANRVRLAVLLTATRRLLRARGCLVLITDHVHTDLAGPYDYSHVIQAAAGSGLNYLQHIVAVAADLDGDQFSYYATDTDLLTLARAGGQHAAHLRVHADLLVFAHRPTPREHR